MRIFGGALPPYPSDAAGGAGDVEGADADVNGKCADSSEASPLSLSNFLGSDPDAGGSSRKRARRERQFSESPLYIYLYSYIDSDPDAGGSSR